MQCPIKFCQKYNIKEYGLVIMILLLIGIIWLFKLNQPLFYAINNLHTVFPVVVWQMLNFVSYTKFAILPMVLVLITFSFHRDKLSNIILLIGIFYVIFYILKVLIAEPRPYMVLPADSFYWLNEFEDATKNAYKSFPSGHTGNMAIFVFSLIQLFFSRSILIQILLLILLVLTGLSRVCTGWHWPVDVLASGVIGYILVQFCLKVNFSKFKNSL